MLLAPPCVGSVCVPVVTRKYGVFATAADLKTVRAFHFLYSAEAALLKDLQLIRSHRLAEARHSHGITHTGSARSSAELGLHLRK